MAEPPKISVYGVRLADLSLTQGKAILALRIENPNPYSIPLRGLNYNLLLNNIKVAEGDVQKNLTITGHEDRIIEVPVNIQFASLLQTLPGLVKTRKFTYDLSGNTQFPFLSIPFKRIGRVGAY